MALYTDERRIGVLGMQQAGKSTFLTSLINHLQDHHPGEFPLGNATTHVEFRELPPAGDGTPEFPYEKFREQLHGRRWPGKTTALSEYRCQLDFTGGRRNLMDRVRRAVSETRLILTDLPGERLADVSMAGSTYAEWSDELLALLDEKFDYLEASRDYLRLVEGAGTLEAGPVVAEFKRALCRLALQYVPVITPSTLCVTPTGEYIPKDVRKSGDAEALAKVRFVGLDADREFAPLPAAARAANPALAETFARHYTAYRDQIVTPLADKFFACDQLVVLVDPTVLLAAGVGAYNGCAHMLATALAYLAPGRTPLPTLADRVVQFLTAGRSRLPYAPKVRKIAVVASQADKVHRDDRDKLGDLVRVMVQPLLRNVVARQWLTVEYFVCSAVDSSASLEYPNLEVRPFDENGRPESQTRSVKVSPVPARWPKTWPAGEYFYPRFAPVPPDRAGHPPSHIGLNRVAEFLFDL
ncbi:YcjX family protein [Limnoglobus roseus]|uniref:YcjX-like protein n=1 Tax=Limnoglobus roseus TaxID=2598579 RepID=A0A5C1ABL4_9BACT|nr:YcjX family protein [Limnoglobus roseus]QEL14418.1 YcjX-like protein [Limnoglobus roseus]